MYHILEGTLNSMTVLMLLNIWVMLVRQGSPSLALLSQHTIPVVPPHCLELACTKREKKTVQIFFANRKAHDADTSSQASELFNFYPRDLQGLHIQGTK